MASQLAKGDVPESISEYQAIPGISGDELRAALVQEGIIDPAALVGNGPYPAIATVMMGWSWAVWAVHSTVEH